MQQGVCRVRVQEFTYLFCCGVGGGGGGVPAGPYQISDHPCLDSGRKLLEFPVLAGWASSGLLAKYESLGFSP